MKTLQTRGIIDSAKLVGRYANPLAIFLVAIGVVLSQPISPVREISIGLLAFSILFNTLFLEWLKRRESVRSWVLESRLWLNLLVNGILVYYLGGYFPQIWLLFVLSPVAMAIYGSKGRTFLVAGVTSAALLAIHATRGLNAPVDWGREIAKVAFIIIVSMMVNSLTQPLRRNDP